MKIRQFLVPSIVAAVTLTLVSALLVRELPGTFVRMRLVPPYRAGDCEDPDARDRWMLMRLRDPATGRIPVGIRASELAHAAGMPTRESRTLLRPSSAPTLEWRSLGPDNVGGRTRALAVDVTDERTMLAGAVTGGMWRSTDAGISWTRTTTLSQLPSVTCIAQDVRPGKENIWYYGTGEFRTNSDRFGGSVYIGDGIFRSVDGGRSWSQLPSTVSGTPHRVDQGFDFVGAIATDPSNLKQDEVYAAVLGAIERSTDGGETWTNVLGGPENRSSFSDVVVTRGGIVYAALSSDGATHGIFRSTDGVSWTNITPVGWSGSYRRMVIATAPSNENLFDILAETPGSGLEVPGSYGSPEYYSLWTYLYVSGDGSGSGGVWTDKSADLPADYNGLKSYAMMLKVHPDNDEIVYLGGTNLYRSSDGFSSRENTTWLGGYGQNGSWGGHGGLHPDQHNLVFTSQESRLYAANDGGVVRIDSQFVDSLFWQPVNDGYRTSQFYTVAIDHAIPGSRVIVGGLQDNGTYAIGLPETGDEWAMIGGGDGAYCAVEDSAGGVCLSSQLGYTLRYSYRDGMFNGFARIDPQGGSGYLFINPFTLDPNDTRVMYMAGGNQLWRNSDITAIPFDYAYKPTPVNWKVIAEVDSPSVISAIGVVRSGPTGRVYYGTTDGHVFRIDDPLDPEPMEVTGAGFPSGGYVNCLAVDPHDGNRVIAVFSNYNVQSLFLTTDGGASWTPISGNLEAEPDGSGGGPSCRWVSILHRGVGTFYFVGTSTGLYSTNRLDGMATEWVQEGASTIGNAIVDMIDSRESDGFVAVATWGSGVFGSTVGVLGVPGEERSRSETVSLELKGPSPARETTTIAFTVPTGPVRSTVDVALYDILGGRAVTAVAEQLAPGMYERTIDLHELMPGTYLCRLTVGGKIVVRSLCVMR